MVESLKALNKQQLYSLAERLDVAIPDTTTEKLREYLAERLDDNTPVSQSVSTPTLAREKQRISSQPFEDILASLQQHGVSTVVITDKQQAVDKYMSVIQGGLVAKLSPERSKVSVTPPISPTFDVDLNLLQDLPTKPSRGKAINVDYPSPESIAVGVDECSRNPWLANVDCIGFLMTSSRKILLRTLEWDQVHSDATFDDLLQCYLWITASQAPLVVGEERFGDILRSSKERLRRSLRKSRQAFVEYLNKYGAKFRWVLDPRLEEDTISGMDWATLVIIVAYARVPRVVNIQEIQRYQELRNYGGRYLYTLTKYVYPEYFMSLLTPARYLALRNASRVEAILPCCSLDDIDDDEIDSLASRIGMVFPPDARRQEYFWEQLSQYRDVKDNLHVVPTLDGVPMADAIDVLKQHTDHNLLKAIGMEPVSLGNWNTRHEFLRRIYNAWLCSPVWKLDDQGVWYVPPGSEEDIYYPFEQLTNAFRQCNSFVDPEASNKQDTEFPVESMTQLASLLEQTPDERNAELRGVITRLTNQQVEKQEDFERYADWIAYLTDKQRDTVINYACWLFLFGMDCRGWKGFGLPYPVCCDKCPVAVRKGERQKNIRRRYSQRYLYETDLEEYGTLAMLAIPMVHYNFFSGSLQPIADYDIVAKDFVNDVIDGKRCLRKSSDALITTAYYILRYTIGLTLDDLNNALERNAAPDPENPCCQPEFNPAEYSSARE